MIRREASITTSSVINSTRRSRSPLFRAAKALFAISTFSCDIARAVSRSLREARLNLPSVALGAPIRQGEPRTGCGLLVPPRPLGTPAVNPLAESRGAQAPLRSVGCPDAQVPVFAPSPNFPKLHSTTTPPHESLSRDLAPPWRAGTPPHQALSRQDPDAGCRMSQAPRPALRRRWPTRSRDLLAWRPQHTHPGERCLLRVVCRYLRPSHDHLVSTPRRLDRRVLSAPRAQSHYGIT